MLAGVGCPRAKDTLRGLELRRDISWNIPHIPIDIHWIRQLSNLLDSMMTIASKMHRKNAGLESCLPAASDLYENLTDIVKNMEVVKKTYFDFTDVGSRDFYL